MNDEERCLAEFEKLGEPYIREQFERQKLNSFRRRLATHWLAERERERSESSHAENASLARSAASAVRDQADAAREANDIARLANKKASTANAIAIIAAIIAAISAAFSAYAIWK